MSDTARGSAFAKAAMLITVGLATTSPASRLASMENSTQAVQHKIVFHADGETIDAVDGDTVWIGIHKVRLKGIEALESRQSCKDHQGEVQCAEQGRRYLLSLMTLPGARCEVQYDNFGKPAMDRNRYLATCYAGDLEINTKLVEVGWALADPKRASVEIRAAEALAKARGVGLHQYTFQMPWDFRNPKDRPSAPECDD